MHILVAFDKLKDSLTAPEACTITAEALHARHADWTFDICPLTDGGEGFGEILTHAAGGTLETHRVTGPLGAPLEARIGFVSLAAIAPAARALLALPEQPSGDCIAVVEMAAASGLALVPTARRDPWRTTSFGTGELMQLAAQRGVAAILLGVGGSATHDLGLGALNALGFGFPTTDQRSISPPIPAGWSAISRVEGGISPGFPPIRIACDVTNPLVGPRGAAATYGPQKGLQPEDLARLDGESGRLARLLCARCGQPESVMETAGAGAAGGIAFGLMAAAGARLLSGFDLVSAWLDVDARLARADLVITGEGRFDASSFNGKGPGAIAARAIALGKSTHVFAGSLGHGLSSSSDEKKNLTLHAISPPHLELADALRAAPANLAAAVRAAF